MSSLHMSDQINNNLFGINMRLYSDFIIDFILLIPVFNTTYFTKQSLNYYYTLNIISTMERNFAVFF